MVPTSSASARKPVILVLIDYYLPGFKAGGPLRTLDNMVQRLSCEYEFLIITRDRDLGDERAYSGIKLGQWVTAGFAKVFYIPKDQWGFRSINALLNKTEFDILYLNSFFSLWTTVLPLVFRRLKIIPNVPIVLAPRGEFSEGAVKIKWLKKSLFLFMSRVFGLYRNVIWQASSVGELADITRPNRYPNGLVLVAPDLIPSVPIRMQSSPLDSFKPGHVRLIFLSRISQKKNLDFILRALSLASSSVVFDIFGPIEDSKYWDECCELISMLPVNVKVSFGGHLPHSMIPNTFGKYDYFVFPTHGENFGHVIFESLSAGTPVLVSDQTPWKSDTDGALRTLPLELKLWSSELDALASLSGSERLRLRNAAITYAQAYLENCEPLQLNRTLFSTALCTTSRKH